MSDSGSPSPADALARLQAGNTAFRRDATLIGDLTHRRRLEIAREQRPFATLVGCSDSRVGPEQLFGTGLGDLFIVRNAGNTVGVHGLGSIEYSIAELGVPLVVVLGHERCGAVTAAIEVLQHGRTLPGSIAAMVSSILPAVSPLIGTLEGPELVSAAVHANVRATVARLRESSEAIITQPRAEGRLWIVGAYYDLDTGHVDFFDLEKS